MCLGFRLAGYAHANVSLSASAIVENDDDDDLALEPELEQALSRDISAQSNRGARKPTD